MRSFDFKVNITSYYLKTRLWAIPVQRELTRLKNKYTNISERGRGFKRFMKLKTYKSDRTRRTTFNYGKIDKYQSRGRSVQWTNKQSTKRPVRPTLSVSCMGSSHKAIVSYEPALHVVPWKPNTHSQVNSSPFSVHVPPLRQGWLEHGFTADRDSGMNRKKVISRTDFRSGPNIHKTLLSLVVD